MIRLAEAKNDSHQKVYNEVARLLQRIVEGKLTGNFQVSFSANQGGVSGAKCCQVIVFEDK